MTARPVVLVTSRSFSSGRLDGRGQLEAAGLEVVVGPADHELTTLRPLLADTVAWVAGAGPVTAEHLDAAPRLRLVARYGVGVDAVDVTAAAQRDVLVTNTPGANSEAVADLAMALILAALRGLTGGDRGVRAGRWQVQRSRELGHLCVGIVGLGRIGRALLQRLSGFGCTVLGHDPGLADDDLRSLGVAPVALPELAGRCDVVSLHAPGEQLVVDARWLAHAAPGQIVVNTARASLVDEDAVAAALREGRLRMYATDTLGSEPGSRCGREPSPLLAPELTDRTIFTPHSGAHTVEAVDAMTGGALAAVLAMFRGEDPPNRVDPRKIDPQKEDS